jgi:general secretion pathway protein I
MCDDRGSTSPPSRDDHGLAVPPTRDERGFTLLEVLIATLIAAAMFAVLLQTALSGIRTVRNAGDYETAMALARSHVAMLGRDMADAPADSHGSDGPFDWRVRVTREAVASSGAGIVNWFLHKDEAHAALYAVSVTVSWRLEGQQRALHIDTKRLGYALPPPPETP